MKLSPNDALGWIGQQVEEVGRGGSGRLLKTETMKVLHGRIGWSKVHLATFLQQGDSVKVLIDRLASPYHAHLSWFP